MAQGNFSKARIEAYLGRKFRTQDDDNQLAEVKLSNAGQPDSVNYISYWSPDLEKSQPTEEQLIALKTEGDAIVKSNQAINARRTAYGTTEKQLEYIVENGLESFIAKQNQIKLDNPKE
tara:strand:+ start:225 stop:581 length:357 start_codon:yes stop_codon:yes gene_type:complete